MHGSVMSENPKWVGFVPTTARTDLAVLLQGNYLCQGRRSRDHHRRANGKSTGGKLHDVPPFRTTNFVSGVWDGELKIV
jgi:hypothetical protein